MHHEIPAAMAFRDNRNDNPSNKPLKPSSRTIPVTADHTVGYLIGSSCTLVLMVSKGPVSVVAIPAESTAEQELISADVEELNNAEPPVDGPLLVGSNLLTESLVLAAS